MQLYSALCVSACVCVCVAPVLIIQYYTSEWHGTYCCLQANDLTVPFTLSRAPSPARSSVCVRVRWDVQTDTYYITQPAAQLNAFKIIAKMD